MKTTAFHFMRLAPRLLGFTPRLQPARWIFALSFLALWLSLGGCGGGASESGLAQLTIDEQGPPDAGTVEEGTDLGLVSSRTIKSWVITNRGRESATKITTTMAWAPRSRREGVSAAAVSSEPVAFAPLNPAHRRWLSRAGVSPWSGCQARRQP